MKKSIRGLAIRAITKGKTRGRPSKNEIAISTMMSYLIEKNRKVISDVIVDTAIGGTGILRIKYKSGNIKMDRVGKP